MAEPQLTVVSDWGQVASSPPRAMPTTTSSPAGEGTGGHDLYAGWHEVGDARRQPDPEVHVLPICELTSDARRQLVPR